jgi:hypothetical protein
MKRGLREEMELCSLFTRGVIVGMNGFVPGRFLWNISI